jgi:L-glyceraldehyde 3-phosphate reductase
LDAGITHFDLANNYGPPYGSAEEDFGRILREDLSAYRDELIISSKAVDDMWRGRTGSGVTEALAREPRQSLARMGLGYVDIFYSHRYDPHTPLDETMGALDTAVRPGKALSVGLPALDRLDFTEEDLAEIDRFATESDINLWAEPSRGSDSNAWAPGESSDPLFRGEARIAHL